jgi:hypothetical protein
MSQERRKKPSQIIYATKPFDTTDGAQTLTVDQD